MSDRTKEPDAGYGKLPKNTRFKKGQSGNPRGRPRKQVQAPSPDPLLPIEAAIRREAARLVTVRDGDERVSIPTVDGVIRALGHAAMKGGVFAQRTFIELQRDIQQRDLERKKHSFERWQNYVEVTRNRIRTAKERDQPELEPIPHPDDIEFDYGSLEVRVTGPLNAEEAALTRRNQRLSRLCVEMSLYHQEGNVLGEGPIAKARVGIWLLSHVALEQALPKRMRISLHDRPEADRRRVRHQVWVAWMRQECAELDIPFIKATKPWPVFELGALGLKLPAHRYE